MKFLDLNACLIVCFGTIFGREEKKNERASGRNLKTNRSIKSLLKMFINIFFIKLPSQTFGSVQLFGLDGFIDVNLTLGIHHFFFLRRLEGGLSPNQHFSPPSTKIRTKMPIQIKLLENHWAAHGIHFI